MTKLFLAYPFATRRFATQLSFELRQRYIDTWSTLDVQPNESLREALGAAVIDADAIVVIWNADAAKSRNVNYELGLAAGASKRLIFVQMDDQPFPIDIAPHRIVRSPSNSMDEVAGIIAAMFPIEAKIPPPVKTETAKNRGFAFLSYAEEDFSFVHKLAAFLRDEGFLFWDYSSGDRDVETMLYLELEARINDSAIVLSVVSPDWKKAVWPAREYFYAKEIGRPVFLVECREIGPTLAIAGEHRIRCWGDHQQEGFELLSRELKRRGL